jgi:hypothetical protein
MTNTIDNGGYHTIKNASAALNIPYWKLLRAVNAGLIPHHRLLNSTKYVKLHEVEETMQTVARHVPDTPETHQGSG